MNEIIFGVYGVLIAVLLACAFMLRRNEWVCDVRIQELRKMPVERGLHEHDRLPSYDEMLFKFWIWDVEKFKTGAEYE